MDVKSLPTPGTVQHSPNARVDADLRREVRGHYDAQPGVLFLVDVLTALHAQPDAVRWPSAFYAKFPATLVMDAFARRSDLRANVVHALTGTPRSLLRRMPPAYLATELELLVREDIPTDERVVRAEEDRGRSVVALYLKYLDPMDLCAYVAPSEIWAYECSDAWWERASDAHRRLMAAELKSIRRHKILSDTELIDRLGNDVLERDLPLRVRTDIRAAARAAALNKKVFTDSDVFDCVRSPDGSRDLVDELVACVALRHLRLIVARAAELLGLGNVESSTAARQDATATATAGAGNGAGVIAGGDDEPNGHPPAADGKSTAPRKPASVPPAATATATSASKPMGGAASMVASVETMAVVEIVDDFFTEGVDATAPQPAIPRIEAASFDDLGNTEVRAPPDKPDGRSRRR
jgi:hypothetical protein